MSVTQPSGTPTSGKKIQETEAQSPLPLMELESPRSVTLRCIHECQQHDITAEGDTGQEAMQQGRTAG